MVKEFIGGVPVGASYQQAAKKLGISQNAAKAAASRLRLRYRELIREVVSRTLTEPEEVEDEIGVLFEALG